MITRFLFPRGALGLLVVLATAAAASGPQAVLAENPEELAKRIEGRLMAPCCGTTVLAEHYSGAALQMRAEIRRMVEDGRTEEEIVDHYVAKHGELILSSPRAEGFNLVAYGLPLLLLVVVIGLSALALRRWKRVAADEGPQPDAGRIDPEYAARLRRELMQRE